MVNTQAKHSMSVFYSEDIFIRIVVVLLSMIEEVDMDGESGRWACIFEGGGSWL